MKQIIEHLAKDTDITVEKVNHIFISISSELVNKIPALQQVFEDVFENVEADILKQHIKKMIVQLEDQQWKEKFGAWIFPDSTEVKHREASNELL